MIKLCSSLLLPSSPSSYSNSSFAYESKLHILTPSSFQIQTFTHSGIKASFISITRYLYINQKSVWIEDEIMDVLQCIMAITSKAPIHWTTFSCFYNRNVEIYLRLSKGKVGVKLFLIVLYLFSRVVMELFHYHKDKH